MSSLKTGFRWLRHWLLGDRVRVSPEVGRWLQWEPGQTVIYRDRLLEIVSREKIQDGTRTGIRYRVVDAQSDSVRFGGANDSPILIDDARITLNERDEFEIWLDDARGIG